MNDKSLGGESGAPGRLRFLSFTLLWIPVAFVLFDAFFPREDMLRELERRGVSGVRLCMLATWDSRGSNDLASRYFVTISTEPLRINSFGVAAREQSGAVTAREHGLFGAIFWPAAWILIGSIPPVIARRRAA